MTLMGLSQKVTLEGRTDLVAGKPASRDNNDFVASFVVANDLDDAAAGDVGKVLFLALVVVVEDAPFGSPVSGKATASCRVFGHISG